MVGKFIKKVVKVLENGKIVTATIFTIQANYIMQQLIELGKLVIGFDFIIRILISA